MAVEEIIEELLEIINNQGKLTVKDLVDIVNNVSIEDRIASSDALTVFYTRGSERLINKLVEAADENVRILRRAEAYELLTHKIFEYILEYAVRYDNPSMSDVEIGQEVNRLLYEASYYDESGNFVEGEGFWTVISRRFAAATTGDAYSLCCHGKQNRIFFSDELRIWLNAVSDDKRMHGYTKTELLAMSENKISDTYILKNAGASGIVGGTAGGAVGIIIGDIITKFEELVSDTFGYLVDLFGIASSEKRYNDDILVIDSDNDGFELTTVKGGVYLTDETEKENSMAYILYDYMKNILKNFFVFCIL